MPKSRSLALARQSDAVSLFRRGSTFQQIAKSVGFANRGTAHRVVTNAYRERIAEDIDHHRATEVARLDALQAEMWDVMERSKTADAATFTRAVAAIVDIIGQRAKILGLYDHPPAESQMLIRPAEGNAGKATSDPEKVGKHTEAA